MAERRLFSTYWATLDLRVESDSQGVLYAVTHTVGSHPYHGRLPESAQRTIC
jgi:hypothetical protein